MSREIIHLVNGETISAEVNGRTMDGQRGYVLLSVDTGNVRRSLAESLEIEVEKRDGEWWEVQEIFTQSDGESANHSDSSESAWWNPSGE